MISVFRVQKEKHPLNCLTIVTLAVSIRTAFSISLLHHGANLSCLAESAFGPTLRHPKIPSYSRSHSWERRLCFRSGVICPME